MGCSACGAKNTNTPVRVSARVLDPKESKALEILMTAKITNDVRGQNKSNNPSN